MLAAIVLAVPAVAFAVSMPGASVASGTMFDHIVVIVLENHSTCDIYSGCGGSATYLSSLADTWSLTQGYTAVDHPSEPNYLALVSGLAGDCGNPAPNTGGCLSGGGDSISDSGPTAPSGSYSSNAVNIVDRLESNGLTWDAYFEGSSGGCDQSFGTAYHASLLFMDDIVSSSARCSHIHSFSTTSPTNLVAELNGAGANLIWINPDNSHNMHDNSISSGDAYMSTLIPQILGSTEFTTTKAVLFVTFDEGNNSYPSDHVYTVFAGPAAKLAYKSTSQYSHYSFLATLEHNWGLACLVSTDCNAPPMTEFFGASPSPIYPNCGAPITTTTNLVVGGGTLATGGFTPGIPDKRSTAPPCFVKGNVMYIKILNVTLSNIANGAASQDCNLINGVTYCDSTADALSFGSTHTLHIEIDQTWKAGGMAPPDFPTNGSRIDITGFAYWDNQTSELQWEMHSVSAWNIVKPTATGNFGTCTSLPQGWNCGNTRGLAGTTAAITNGVLVTDLFASGIGNDSNYYYATTQKGTFPWSPCKAPASGVVPTGITSVSSNFTFLSYNPGSSPSSDRYQIYIALYYWLPNGPVSAGGSTYQCLDTQVRVENVGGIFSAVGSTATYNPGDSFGWDQVTTQTSPGQSGTLTANVAQQCQDDLAAWGLPTNTPCELAGIEIGTEGFQFQELDVNWYNVSLATATPPSLTAGLSFTPSSPITGQSVSFAGTASGGTSPYAYSWNFGDGATATGQNSSHIYSSVGTYTATLTVTDASSPQQKAVASKTVTVTVPALAASFTFAPSSPQVNSLITFTGSGSGGVTPYLYSWTFGDGQTASGAIVTYAYATAGIFAVTLTLTDAATTQAISTQNLTIAPLPITASFTITPNPTEVNVPVSFSATATGGTPPYVNFSWNFGDGSALGSGSLVTHAYASAGTFSVTVTVEDSAGKTGTSSAQSVVVNSNLVVSAITASPNPANTGQTVNFIATTSGGVAPVTCTWDFGDGATGTGCSTNQIYGTAGNFTATVKVTDSLGVAISQSVAVEITASPQCIVSLVFSLATPEATSPLTFTATATNCAAPVSFAWSFGDGSTGSGITATHIYSTSGTFSITVTATDSSSPPQIATSSGSIMVVAAVTVPSATASPNPNDEGVPSSFSASINGGVGGVSCNWTFGDGASSTGCSTTHVYSNPGTFIVVVTAQDSLGVTASKTISEIVNAQPTVSFTISPTSPVNGQSVTFTATTGGGTSPFAFSWNFGDNSSGSGNVASHAYLVQGSYIVTLTATDVDAKTTTSTQTLAVASSPLTASFAVTPPSGLIVGQLASFTASVSGGTSPYTFSWNFGDSSVSTGNAVSHSFRAGNYTVTLTVTDSSVPNETAIVSQTITITTRPLTLVVPRSQTVNEGFLLTFNVSATGDPSRTISIVCDNCLAIGATFTTNGGLGSSSGSFTWTPAEGQGPSTYMVSISASDGTLIVSANVSVSVNEVVEQPVLIVPGPIHVSQGETIHFMVNLTDLDSAADNVTLGASGLPNGASFDPSTGIFNWNVSSVQPGLYTITFTATSSGSTPLQDSAIVTIHVDDGNGHCFICTFFSTARTVLHASTLEANPWMLLLSGVIGLTTTLAVMTRRARAQLRASRRMVSHHKKE
jgi:PKD repeat protein